MAARAATAPKPDWSQLTSYLIGRVTGTGVRIRIGHQFRTEPLERRKAALAKLLRRPGHDIH